MKNAPNYKDVSAKEFKEPNVNVNTYAKELKKVHGKEAAMRIASKYANENNKLTDDLTKNFFTLVLRELK